MVALSMSSAMARLWLNFSTSSAWSRSSQLRLSMVTMVPVRMTVFTS
jgi:hypothetical protein